MKNSLRLIGLQFIFVFFVSAVAAQTPRTSPTPIVEDTTVSKTFEVRLPVTVTEKKKALVSGLSRGDFAVFEDGVQQEVTFFPTKKRIRRFTSAC